MQLILCVACMILLVAGVCVDDSYCFALRRDSRSVDNGHVGKKGRHLPSYPDYAKNDNLRALPTCSSAQAFDVSDSYIIRTKDSKENGAYYINAVKVRTFEVCLEQCCLNEVCDTAIYRSDESSSDPNEANCFLFECRPEGDGGPNVCSFTYHKGYVSSIMLEGVREHGIEDQQGEQDPPRPITVTEEPRQTPKRQTVNPTTLPPPPVVLVVNADDDESSDCESGHVQCTSGECINELYVCNSVLDCRDGSDEAHCSTADGDTDGAELQNEDTHTDLWNTWPYYYPSSVVDENEFDDDVRGRNSAGRGKPSQAAGSGVSRLRPRPKVHQTNGIPHSVTTHTHPPPTPPVTLSPLQLDIVTKVDTVDKGRTDTEGATTPRPTRGNKTSPAKEAESNGLMDDTNEVDAVEVVRGEGMPTAKSAILALVVGLIITVCLLLMVGCRLRYMNQRLRYGRLKTSAHDADYLINGMYL